MVFFPPLFLGTIWAAVVLLAPLQTRCSLQIGSRLITFALTTGQGPSPSS